MFKKMSEFFIKNTQIALVLLLSIVVWGVFSWFLAPKQYNPSITTPVFQVTFIAPWLSKEEVNNTIVEKLDNKVWEIDWIEHVMSKSIDNAWIIQAQFISWTDLTVAKTRVLNKLEAVKSEIPTSVARYYFNPIDTEDIPIYGFALTYEWEDKTEAEARIQIREIQNDIIAKLKYVKNTSVFYEIGGEKSNVNVRIDIDKLNAKWVDLLQVLSVIDENNKSYLWGDFYVWDTKNTLSINGNLETPDSILNLIIWNRNGSPIYVSDVATVNLGVSERKDVTYFNNGNGLHISWVVWVAKRKGTNATFVTESIQKELKEVEKELPEWFTITETYNEGKRAAEATNSLIVNLITSLIIVFWVLYLYMWARRSLIVAATIPLTFLLVFGIVYLTWDNINKVTLASLIVALWMLVDDSTVVVDNINQNSQKEEFKNTPIIELIKYSVNEVWTWLILAATTRIIAFSAMFMVTWAMGQFIAPVPTYIIFSMIISNFLALTVTPFFYYFLKRNVKVVTKKQDDKNKLLKAYEKYIKSIIWTSKKHWKRRKKITCLFVITFVLSLAIPVSLGLINKANTPKADQEELTLFVDLPRNTTLETSEDLTKKIDSTLSCFLVNSEDCKDKWIENKGLKIVKNIVYNVWVPPLADWSNMIRRAPERKWENYISIKMLLTDTWDRDIESTNFNLKLSEVLKPKILRIEPLAKVKVLDTSAWVPNRAEFELKISTKGKHDRNELNKLTELLYSNIKEPLNEVYVKDHYTTLENYQNKYEIKLNHEVITRAGLTSKQVWNTLTTIFKGLYISETKDDRYREANKIFISIDEEQKRTEDIFNKITFTNKFGRKVYLKDIADLTVKENTQDIENFDREMVTYIYGETTYYSISQIVSKIKWLTDSDEFWNGKYKVIKSDKMNTVIKDTELWTEFTLNYRWDWKTMNEAIAELQNAIILSFIVIFLIMTTKFKSFAVWGVIMTTFMFWFIWIIPWFGALYLLNGTLFSSIWNLWVLSLIWIVTWNAIILIEQYLFNRKSWLWLEEALIKSTTSRFGPIIATNVTTILWILTLVTDSIWWAMAWTMTFGLITSVLLTLLVLPVFIYNVYKKQEKVA